MRKKLPLPDPTYRGRFAPSPTGPPHFGSLVAAVASYLDAKHHNGTWLVRIEDLDTPRCIPGAADDILRTLEAYGLCWDEEVIYQNRRTAAYQAAFEQLRPCLYPCACSRKEIADSALQHGDELIYPGICRNGLPPGKAARAWRVRVSSFPSPHGGEGLGERDCCKTHLPSPQPSPCKGEGVIEFDDALQGHIAQHLESEIGDFVVKRADGLFAYQLAVVVDDAAQRITNVVRGADLLYSTPRQIFLQRLLGFTTPSYMHLPVAVNALGEKLSKQTLAPAIVTDDVVATLISMLEFLRQQPPAELRQGSIEEILGWAVAHWQPEKLKGCRQLPAPP